jgi:hypothetical protein
VYAFALTVALSVSSARAQVDREPNRQTPAQGESQTAIAPEPEPESDLKAEAAPKAPSEPASSTEPPEGDLLHLSKHPEAELLVNVELSGNDTAARYEIRSSVSDAVLLKCHNKCSFRIWPGRYRLLTLSSAGRPNGDEPILIDRDSRLHITSPSPFEAILGGLLTAVGTAALVAGVVKYRHDTCHRGCSDDVANGNQVGVALMLGGVVTIPIGVVLMDSGLSPDVAFAVAEGSRSDKVARLPMRPAQGLSWSLEF